MGSLSNIRSRLRAIESIKQITTSMEMVASARLRKAQILAKQAQFYIVKIREILERLEGSPVIYKHPLFEKRELKKIGLVIVSSDRGLCGSYNSRIFSEADSFLQKHSEKNVELILVGRKAVQHYQHKKKSVKERLIQWSGKITHDEIKAFGERLITAFLKKDLDAIWFVYTQFHSLMKREIVVEQLFPISKPPSEKKNVQVNYLFEPNLEEIYAYIVNRYCIAKIQSILDQAHAAELAARIFSMKAAASNAEEMQETLTLERNKIR